MQKVAELKEGAAGRAAVVLSQLLAERDVGSTPAGNPNPNPNPYPNPNPNYP